MSASYFQNWPSDFSLPTPIIYLSDRDRKRFHPSCFGSR